MPALIVRKLKSQNMYCIKKTYLYMLKCLICKFQYKIFVGAGNFVNRSTCFYISSFIIRIIISTFTPYHCLFSSSRTRLRMLQY